MSETIEQLISIDLGNGFTSYMTGTNLKGSFASLVTEAKGSIGLGGGYSRDVFKTKDGQWLVGDDCREAGALTRSTDSSFYSSNEIRVLLLKVLKDAGIKNPIIVTGLPTEFFKSHRQEFQDQIKRWALAEGYQPAKVQVLPQYAAPWFDPELLDEKGEPIDPGSVTRGKWGIIDIGQGTIDGGQFENGKASEQRFGESKGVSDIHKALFTQLSKPEALNEKIKSVKARLPKDFRLDRQTTEFTMDTWLRQGFIPWCGEELPMDPISYPARSEFADDALPRTIDKLWGSTNFLTGMVCAGGGTTVLGLELLKRHIKCKIVRAKDPEWSIVRGLFRYYVSQNFKSQAVVKNVHG